MGPLTSVIEPALQSVGSERERTSLADDDGELSLVVKLAGHVRVRIDLGTGSDDRGCALGEDDGKVGLLVRVARVVSGALELPERSGNGAVSVSSCAVTPSPSTYRACSV